MFNPSFFSLEQPPIGNIPLSQKPEQDQEITQSENPQSKQGELNKLHQKIENTSGTLRSEKTSLEIGSQSPLSEQEMKSHKFISDIGRRAEIHVANIYKLVSEILSKAIEENAQKVPTLKLVDGEGARFTNEGESPEIFLGKDEFIRSTAETLGEEFGHFLRDKLTDRLSKIDAEYLTDEFFGFLGRRLLFEKLDPEQRQLLFPDGAPSLEKNYEGASKGDILKELRPLGKIKRSLGKEYELAEKLGNKDKIKEIARKAEEEGVKGWFKTITHYRGYEFASKVDLSKIKDWNKLYSMPDREVRRRFFTPNPDYSGL